MHKDQIGLWEINEAFSSQSTFWVKELGIDIKKGNLLKKRLFIILYNSKPQRWSHYIKSPPRVYRDDIDGCSAGRNEKKKIKIWSYFHMYCIWNGSCLCYGEWIKLIIYSLTIIIYILNKLYYKLYIYILYLYNDPGGRDQSLFTYWF